MLPRPLTKQQKDDIDKIRPYIGDASADRIGQFKENVGGGTPVKGGGRGAMRKDFVIADDPDDPVAQKAKADGKKVRYRQPRDDDGQFTYNSANAKKLYYGPKSRGKTTVPFLLQRLVKKIENEGTDVVVGQDQLSYLFHNKDLSAYKAKEELKEYITFKYDKDGNREVDKTDWTNSGKNILQEHEQAYEHKKGRKSGTEQQALQQGITGKIGERKTVNGKTKYSYMSKLVTPVNPNVMSKYFDANGNPIGKNVIKPNNPNITPKTAKQTIQSSINQAKGGNQQHTNANGSIPSQNIQNAQPQNTVNNNQQPKPQQQQQAAPQQQQQAPAAAATQNKPVDYSQKIDANAVANDPKKFIADNRAAINSLINEAKNLGLNLNVNALVGAAKSGEISSLQDVADELKKYKN